MLTKLLLGRYLREKSLIDIERRTGISLSKLIKIDKGEMIPTEEEKRLIAKTLSFSSEEIFPSGQGGSDDY